MMTSFFAADNYSPVLIFVFGIANFIGIQGFGLCLMKAFRFDIPNPWRGAIGVLLGIETVSLLVQLISMANLAYRPVLISLWIVITMVGAICTVTELKSFIPKNIQRPRSWDYLPIAIIIISLLIILLISVVPCNRNDDLHYHMLTPSRIVVDNALHFYRLPWESAIVPHMVFQIATASLHALGFPDATNVLNWCLGFILVWFSWYLISQRSLSASWTYLWLAALIVGMWPAVYYSTSSSHAMGNLAGAMVIIALLDKDILIKKIKIKQYTAVCSFLILCLVSTKASLLPIGFFFLLLLLFIVKKYAKKVELYSCFLLMTIPWLIFYVPIVGWTFIKSGSPFGPIFINIFHKYTIYNNGFFEIINQEFAGIKQNHDILRPLFWQLRKFFVWYSPLLCLSIVLLIISKSINKAIRITAGLIIAVSLSSLLFLTGFELRYISSIFYAFVIAFAMFGSKDFHNKLVVPRIKILPIAFILLIPWLCVQFYYGIQFFPTSLGFSSKQDYFKKYISFYDDYQKLHAILPRNSSLLVQLNGIPYPLNAHDLRMPSTYSPRPIFYHPLDIQIDTEVFLFHIKKPTDKEIIKIPEGFRLGELIYKNPVANYANNIRLPNKHSQIKWITVYHLIKMKR